MNVLYAARMARVDLLRAVSFLAQRVTQWTEFCDRALHRLMCYIHHTARDVSMTGWCGDGSKDIRISFFCDADFSGRQKTARSTSGLFLALVGPNTFLPLSAASKRQTAVSHSTPEAELVAADLGVRTEGLPALSIGEVLFERPVSLVMCEDNETCIRVVETGRNPTMRAAHWQDSQS